jgi:hypothetical protein
VTAPLPLVRTAALVGGYRYVELALFAELGASAPQRPRPEVAVFLAGAARAHGFRAGLFEGLLPVSVGLPGALELTVAPDEQLDAAFSALVKEDDETLIGELVEVLYPSMLATWRAHLDVSSPFSDPPLRRVLERAIADLEQHCGEGRGLVDFASPTSGGSALAKALEAAGGPFGSPKLRG